MMMKSMLYFVSCGSLPTKENILFQIIPVGQCICHQTKQQNPFHQISNQKEEDLVTKKESIVREAEEEIVDMTKAMQKILDFKAHLHDDCLEELQEMKKMGLPTYFVNSPWDKEDDDVHDMVFF